MGRFILFVILIVIGIIILVTSLVRSSELNQTSVFGISAGAVAKGAGTVFIVLSFVSLATGAFYIQDIGEAVVLKNWDGKIIGSSSTAGLHTKAPWVDTIRYDTRNNLINFYNDADYEYKDGTAKGPDVTINDKSGASADIDIQVVYSLDPKASEKLYEDYGTQTNYTQSYLSNDVRAVTREVSGKYDTITMLTDRSQFTKAVQDALSAKWEPDGLNVEQVSVQDVRYPKSITDKYAEAQSAEIAKQQALNEQETEKVKSETKKKTAEIDAETKKINAKAEADANEILNNSLSDNVIKQHYIDALQKIGDKGNLVVVPEGSTPMVNVQNSK